MTARMVFLHGIYEQDAYRTVLKAALAAPNSNVTAPLGAPDAGDSRTSVAVEEAVPGGPDEMKLCLHSGNR